MTKKLTKNDSMCDSAQDFNTIVAAFEAMVSRKGLMLDYFTAWSKKRVLYYGDPLYKQWLNWARSRELEKWVIAALDFHESHIPSTVWYTLDSEWLTWLSQNL